MATKFYLEPPSRLGQATLVLCLVLALLPLIARSAEWQELKHGDTRISSDEPEVELEKDQLELPEGHYAPGEGTIDSAFGIILGTPIPSAHVAREGGWREPPRMPDKPSFMGLVKPLTVQSLILSPPETAPALERQGVTYTAWVDFEQRPIAIETSPFTGATEILEVIQRKYGEPEEVESSHLVYRRDQQSLHIYKLGKDKAFLRYQDLSILVPYMEKRNLSLKRKFRNDDPSDLSPKELEIFTLAKQLETFRRDHGEAFGLPFGKRVGFRATPDEFVPFESAVPLSAFNEGDYRIMVSPDLMPIALRYELSGSEAKLASTKQELELAMELAFAGFLKQTPHHTVLSFKQQAYSLLIRNGKFQFTVHDREENADRNEREKLARRQAAEAEKERQRLAELERQREIIAARQKQIEEEKAF